MSFLASLGALACCAPAVLAPQDPQPAGPTEPPPAARVELALEPGPRLAFTVRLESTDSSVIGKTRLGSRIVSDQEIEIEVRAVEPDGTRRFALHYGRVQGSIENPMADRFQFDSANPPKTYPLLTGPVARQFLLTSGRTFSARVDRRGRVLEIGGFVDAYKGTEVEQMLKIGGQPLVEEFFLDDVQVLFPLLPEDPIGPDARWNRRQTAEFFGHDIPLELDTFATGWSATEAAWAYATAADMEEPVGDLRGKPVDAREERDKGSLEERAMRWQGDGFAVADAAMSGHCRVARADGLTLVSSHQVSMKGKARNPLGGMVDSTIELRYEVRRR